MINLKSAPKEKKDSTLCCPAYEEPAYPYGLTIHLNEETLTKLGLTDMPKVGSTVRIVAMAEVTRCGEQQMQSGATERNLELQITDMDAPGAEAGAKSTADRLYG